MIFMNDYRSNLKGLYVACDRCRGELKNDNKILFSRFYQCNLCDECYEIVKNKIIFNTVSALEDEILYGTKRRNNV